MMARVMGVRDPDTLSRAADLGIAMQLTNIARDVIDDAGAGRVYLPLRWLHEAGIPPADLGDPARRRDVSALVGRLLEIAERHYRSGDVGIRRLDPRSAWAVATARGVYRDIGRIVARRGEHAWDRRAVVGNARKLYRVAQAGLDALLRPGGAGGRPADERREGVYRS
jgi:phytoene synthase